MTPGPSETEAQLTLEAGFAQANEQFGRFNLAIFGMTGVGKSTLVNTIFGENLARTGVGRPVTKGSHLHRTADRRMGVYDTEGLEIGRDSAEIITEMRRQIEDSHTGPLVNQIHVVWYCVRASDRRFTDVESDFVRHLCELGPPVLLVITRIGMTSGGVPPDARELADHIEHEHLPIDGGKIHFVNAQSDEWAGIPAHGLDELLEATSRAAPLGVRRALNAAQRINSARKLQQSTQLVSATAADLELRPLLRNVRKSWAEMIAGISIIYGLPENQAINAALQAREVTAMHRLLYLGQASVLATPVRYVILGGARAKRSLAGTASRKHGTGARRKSSSAGARSNGLPAEVGGEKPPDEADRKKNTGPKKTRTRRRIRHRRIRPTAAGPVVNAAAGQGGEPQPPIHKRPPVLPSQNHAGTPSQNPAGTRQPPATDTNPDAVAGAAGAPAPLQQRQRMGSGLAAGVVTLAVGESWTAVCDRAYRASYPEPPGLQPDAFAREFSEELSKRMSKPLRAWQRISTRKDDA